MQPEGELDWLNSYVVLVTRTRAGTQNWPEQWHNSFLMAELQMCTDLNNFFFHKVCYFMDRIPTRKTRERLDPINQVRQILISLGQMAEFLGGMTSLLPWSPKVQVRSQTGNHDCWLASPGHSQPKRVYLAFPHTYIGTHMTVPWLRILKYVTLSISHWTKAWPFLGVVPP